MNTASKLLREAGYNIYGAPTKRLMKKNKKKKQSPVVKQPAFNPKSKEVKNRMNASRWLIELRNSSDLSVGEKAIADFLTENGIEFKREKTGPKLYNPKTNALLFFDFYLPEYNLVIEFDGCQHYKVINGDVQKLADIKYRDAIKNKFCRDNNIHLLRIRHLKNIESAICAKVDNIQGI